MALLWADGFDHHGNMTEMLKDNYIEANGNIVLDTTTPRTGTTCIRFSAINAQQRFTIALDALRTTVGWGFGVRLTATNTNIKTSLLDNAGAVQLSVTFNSDGSMSVYRGNGVTLLGTSAPNSLSFNTWLWVEIKAFCSDTVGTVEIRVQGNPVLVITGADTQASAVNGFGRVRFGSNETSGTTDGGKDIRFDDLVIWDTAGTDNTDFMGIRRCATSLMTGDGALEQWVPSSGVDSWAMIDEVPANTTDYVSGNVVGDISEFTKAALSILATSIAGIRLSVYAANSDAGVAKFRMGINSAGNVVNSAEITPSTTFGRSSVIIERDPNGNVPWTKTAFDAASIRLTRSS